MDTKIKENKRIEELDILRAVALIMISVFHWFDYKGTYVGVIIFFVLSGYLFSSGEFYNPMPIFKGIKKRILKLYPSLLIVILVSTISLYLLNGKQGLEEIYKSSVVYSILGLNNIFQIVTKLSYFDKDSVILPLTHIWALSFQFQMYLVVPIILLVFRKLNVGKNKTVLIFIGISIISAILMGYYYLLEWQIPADEKNYSRIYYGTDTRMFTFFIASAIGIYYKKRAIKNEWEKIVIKLLGFLGMISVIYYAFFLDYKNPINYYGFMYLTSVLFSFTVLVLVKTKEQSRILSKEWLRKVMMPVIRLGQHQYEYYLWQYPIMIVFREVFKFSELPFEQQFTLQLIVLVIISEVTHYLVNKYNGKAMGIFALGMIMGILFVVPNYLNKDLEEMKNATQNNQSIENEKNVETKEVTTEEGKKEENLENVNTAEGNKTENTAEVTEEVKKDDRKILFIGDSVMEMARNEIQKRYPNSTVKSKVGRQFHHLPELIKQAKSEGKLDKIVVIALGTNGTIFTKDMETIVELLRGHEVYMVSAVVPKSWEKSVNENIKKMVAENSNFHLIDWYSFAKGKREYFYRDGIHPREKYTPKYVDLIFNEVSKR